MLDTQKRPGLAFATYMAIIVTVSIVFWPFALATPVIGFVGTRKWNKGIKYTIFTLVLLFALVLNILYYISLSKGYYRTSRQV